MSCSVTETFLMGLEDLIFVMLSCSFRCD